MKIPNKYKMIPLCFFIALLFWHDFANANQGDQWPYAIVDCNPASQSLTISEGMAASKEDIPKRANVRGLDGMYRQEPVGIDDAQLVVKETFRAKCQLGEINYLIVIAPYKRNLRIQGACGAAAPTIKLEVFKNEQIFLNPIIFKMNCFLDDDFDKSISKVTILTRSSEVLFDIQNGEKELIKNFSFTDLLAISRRDIFSN